MTLTAIIAIGFASSGLVTAITAAIYWRKASVVSSVHAAASISDVPEQYILSNEVAFNASSSLNARRLSSMPSPPSLVSSRKELCSGNARGAQPSGGDSAGKK
jgi:hypothetical protein